MRDSEQTYKKHTISGRMSSLTDTRGTVETDYRISGFPEISSRKGGIVFINNSRHRVSKVRLKWARVLARTRCGCCQPMKVDDNNRAQNYSSALDNSIDPEAPAVAAEVAEC